MKYSQPHSAAAGTRLVEDVEQYDVIIIGAGVTGLYAFKFITICGILCLP